MVAKFPRAAVAWNASGAVPACSPRASIHTFSTEAIVASTVALVTADRQEACDEAHLSTKQLAAGEEARFPCPNEHARRPCGLEVSSGQGSAPSVRLIGRLHGRASFEQIARNGSRVRAGALSCTFVLDPLVWPPRVAYAIGRVVGSAVTRNRIRRRLRALLQRHSPQLPGGLYLIGVRPQAAAQSFSELMFDLDRLIAKAVAAAPSRQRGD